MEFMAFWPWSIDCTVSIKLLKLINICLTAFSIYAYHQRLTIHGMQRKRCGDFRIGEVQILNHTPYNPKFQFTYSNYAKRASLFNNWSS